jgi:cytidylate kinase
MTQRRPVIAIDGLAASGKSALCALLAKRLGFAHLNTGLFYRAVAHVVLGAGKDPENEGAVVAEMQRHTFIPSLDSAGRAVMRVDGVDVSEELTRSAVSAASSVVAKHPDVRKLLLDSQREAFPGTGLVAEGRDMGSVVFPNAEVVFFVEADLEIRAERRLAQLRERGEVVSLEQVIADLQARDERDASRTHAPMKAADGAMIIDNSQRPIEETLEQMYDEVIRRLQSDL